MAENLDFQSAHTGLDIDSAISRALPGGELDKRIDALPSSPSDSASFKGIRKNLLDNAFFGNPVNQRGLLEYPANSYGIDRWKCASNPMFVNDGYVSTLSGGVFTQILENPSLYAGKTLTASVLYADGTLVEGTALYSFSNTVVFVGVGDPTGQVYLSRDGWFQLYQDKGVNYGVVAAKLEIGTGQTLAHQDKNGNWVLNEIPNYAEELAKCQRYFFKGNCRFTYNGSADGGYYYAPAFNFPVTMRIAPVCSYKSLAGTIATLGDFTGAGETAIYQSYSTKPDSPGELRIANNKDQVYWGIVEASADL